MTPKFSRIIIGVVVVAVLLLLMFTNLFITIGAGEGGVLFRPFGDGKILPIC